jgi:hypothetical protein
MAEKELKNRVASVKNVQKITRAMEMISAARLRRAEQRIISLVRPPPPSAQVAGPAVIGGEGVEKVAIDRRIFQ